MSLIHSYGQPDEASRLVEDFRWYLRALRRSADTIRVYTSVAHRFATFCAGMPITEDPVLRYTAQRRLTVSPSTINQELAALRAWFGWLKTAKPDAWQPTSYPKFRKRYDRPVRALSDAEVGMLLAAPDLSTFTGLRDHFLMATLYQCGLRASELVALELGSVRLDGLLHVHGKGSKQRLVPFGGAWYGLLETYLRQRATVGAGKRSALFVTKHGLALRNARSVWVIVNRYARRALGIACGYQRLEAHTGGRPWQGHYPHLLRASFATELQRNGCHIGAISQLLGHEDLATTARYLGVDMEQLRGASSKHPRALRITR